ncbi:MAG: hypothetical protein V4558_08275 [Gemmatimonadota bacterium]
MKGLIRGAAGLAVVLAMSACSKDETIDLMGAPTGVQATPISAFTTKGDSVAILLRLVNDRNQSIPTEFTVGNAGPALTIHYDDKYRPDYTSGELVPPAVKPQQRYFALGTNNGTSTFTATAGGFTSTITVVVLPKTLEAALNKTANLVAGDTVIINAPAGLKFTPTSAVSFATGANAIASRAADSSSISVILGPGTGGIATVTNVFLNYAPTLAVKTYTTTNAVASTPAITVAPTTVSNAAPNIGDTIAVTLGGNLRFLADSKVLIGGTEAGIASVNADSSVAMVIPVRNSTGKVTYTNIALKYLNVVKLAVDGDKNVAVTNTYAGPTLAGTGSPATAPSIFVPAKLGRTVVLTDIGNGGTFNVGGACTHAGENSCKIYKMVLPVAATLDMKLYWKGSADLGLYLINAAGTTASNISSGANIPDQFGPQTDGPEVSAAVAFAAGTYYFLVANYSGLNAISSLQIAFTIR